MIFYTQAGVAQFSTLILTQFQGLSSNCKRVNIYIPRIDSFKDILALGIEAFVLDTVGLNMAHLILLPLA
jgi:hypothetical protein